MGLHQTHREWIEARGLSVDLAEKLGLHTTQREGVAWLAVPYLRDGQVVNHKLRRTSTKDHRMDKGGQLVLWNRDCLTENHDWPVVICEGEWDALAVMSLGLAFRVVSVPNGASGAGKGDGAYTYLKSDVPALMGVKRFILATDGDTAGQALRRDLQSYLGADKCSFVEYPEGTKDLNEVLQKYGAQTVAAVLTKAKPVPVDGLHSLDAFPEAPDLPLTPIGIEGMDNHFGLVPGTFTVITGWAGHGKTSLLMKMLANLLAGGTHVTLGSFETLPRPILERRLKASMLEMPESHPDAYRQGRADEILAKRLKVIAHAPSDDDDTELTIEYILELAKVAVRQYGTKLLVLDPWNEIEHARGKDVTETEYVGLAIKAIKKFAKNHDCAVWLVAHPRKPHSDGNPKPPSLYDLAGSANFANKADFGIVVHRDDLTSKEVAVRFVKRRMGLPGNLGKIDLTWDEARSRYDLSPFSSDGSE